MNSSGIQVAQPIRVLTVVLELLVTPYPALSSEGFGAGRFCYPDTCPTVHESSERPPATVLSQLSPMPGEGTAGMEGWRLVRTPGPDKTDIVSVMRTADLMQSAAEFAGMMVRCRPKGGVQIAFAIITPFKPRSAVKAAVTVNNATIRFDGEVIPPGSLIALPGEAEVLAKGAWQSAREVRVEIEGESGKIQGVVPLQNLAGALAQLQANCP